MRITGGKARGIPLFVPKGDKVRPATDAMRQAVFSSLGARVEGAIFLDLFAGSGAYGLEAVSRGAGQGTFVEKDARTAGCIRTNIVAVCKSLQRSSNDLQVVNADALAVPFAPFPDLVFIDPPYESIPDIAPKFFARLDAQRPERADPLIIFEMPGELTLAPEGWDCVKRLGKGPRQPTVCIFRASQPSP
jgi:16S rRNA (guanine966-N2)-methyltransferase